MGLLDTLGGKLNKNMQDPLRMGLLAYGMTGQGQDPGGTAVNAMMSAAKTKAEKERKAAQMEQITGAFASGSVDPALLAQYSAAGGEGSKEMLDLYKFGRTPQSVAPGQMMIDPTTGKMSMPAPKMGEGQMWDGGQVTSAPGYLQAYGAQKAVDAQNSIDQYAAQQGIGHQYGVDMLNRTQGYDWEKMGAQNQFDIDKTGMQNQYDWNKTGYASDLAKGQEEYRAGLAPQEYYDPATGQMMIGNKLAVTQGGYQASKPESEKIAEAEKAKAQSARFNDYMDKGGLAAKQVGKINQLENLVGSGLRTGSTQPAYDAVGGYLADAGIDVKGLSANQQASKMLLQLAQDIPLPPGAASNVDVQQRLQQLPQMTDGPEAFSASLQTMRSLAELNQDVAAYLNTVGTLTPEIEAEINSMYSEWGKGK